MTTIAMMKTLWILMDAPWTVSLKTVFILQEHTQNTKLNFSMKNAMASIMVI
jgi:hypothetical protein